MPHTVQEKLRINELYDAYGALLTEKQRQYVDYYYRDDYSLSEIANLMEVSRNAVHDQLRIATEHLASYEAALGLVKLKKAAAAIIDRIGELGLDDAELERLVGDIEKTE